MLWLPRSSLRLSCLSLSLFPTAAKAFVSSTTCSSGLASTLLSSKSELRTMATSTPTGDSSFSVAQFLCLGDNYGYLLHDQATGQTAAIDTPCGTTYKAELNRRGWTLTHILNTHHHHDHTGGNLELKQSGVTVVGPKEEKSKIPGLDEAVGSGDSFEFGSSQVQVIDVGGHTKGHVAYYFPDQSKAFVGDSLFTLGCGRMFEGTPTQFWASLERLRALPDDTLMYSAHEYTLANAKFALSVEPNNPHLIQKVAQIKALLDQGKPAVPSLLGDEKKANPFLRADVSDEIRVNVGATATDTPAQAFGKLRKAKDNFR
eukprot:Nitzschia sp. Nitz4//scaffold251_size28233//7898//8931//NITZ4_008132-RA/size28233-augustus-gene-0.9-mRNA-1//1//CDS//3329544238//5111//frame0